MLSLRFIHINRFPAFIVSMCICHVETIKLIYLFIYLFIYLLTEVSSISVVKSLHISRSSSERYEATRGPGAWWLTQLLAIWRQHIHVLTQPGQSTSSKNVGNNIVLLLNIFNFHTVHAKITRNLLHISRNLLSFWGTSSTVPQTPTGVLPWTPLPSQDPSSTILPQYSERIDSDGQLSKK